MIGRSAPQQWYATGRPAALPTSKTRRQVRLDERAARLSGLIIRPCWLATSSPVHSQSRGNRSQAGSRQLRARNSAQRPSMSPPSSGLAAISKHGLLHAAQPPVHLEHAGRDVAADEEFVPARRPGWGMPSIRASSSAGLAVGKAVPNRCCGDAFASGKSSIWLNEPSLTQRMPQSSMCPSPSCSMHDAFHGVVVVHPRLHDIVAHRLADRPPARSPASLPAAARFRGGTT